jgi:hypothetical protein
MSKKDQRRFEIINELIAELEAALQMAENAAVNVRKQYTIENIQSAKNKVKEVKFQIKYLEERK